MLFPLSLRLLESFNFCLLFGKVFALWLLQGVNVLHLFQLIKSMLIIYKNLALCHVLLTYNLYVFVLSAYHLAHILQAGFGLTMLQSAVVHHHASFFEPWVSGTPLTAPSLPASHSAV